MPSAACEVKDGAAAYVPASSGVDITPGNQVVIRLASQAGVDSWSIACLTVDDTSNAATVNAGLVIDSILKTATIAAAPAAGKAWRFKSTVQSGGVKTESIFVLYTKVNGRRVHALDETTESNAVAGWGADINDMIRNPSAGGTTPTGTGLRKVSGGTENPAASLLVDADVATGAAIALSKLGALPGANSQILYRGAGTFATASITTDGAGFSMGSGYTSFGGAPAASGDIRVTYAGATTRSILVVKNSTGTDTPIVTTGPGDACSFGGVGLDFTARGFAGTFAFTGVIGMTSGGTPMINTSAGNTVNIGTTTSFGGGAQASTINMYAATGGSIGIGLNGNTKIYVNGASGMTEFWDKVGGGPQASVALKWAKATIQPTATNAVTLTAAQYASPILLFKAGGGVTGAVAVTAPNQDGEWHIVKNRCGFNVTIGGITIANGADAHISYDSDAAAWGRCT